MNEYENAIETYTKTIDNGTISLEEFNFSYLDLAPNPAIVFKVLLNNQITVARRVVSLCRVDGYSTGDPYIHSANGNLIKLPDESKCYRMLSYNGQTINLEVDKLDIEEDLDIFLYKMGHDSRQNPENGKLITEGYWNKSIFINSDKIVWFIIYLIEKLNLKVAMIILRFLQKTLMKLKNVKILIYVILLKK